MTPADIRRAGEALYGTRWQTKLARALRIDPSNARHWLQGDYKPSGPAQTAIILLLRLNGQDQLATELDEKYPSR